MVTYALTAWLVFGGQVHTSVLDYDLSLEDCMDAARRTVSVQLERSSEFIFVPLQCVPERRA